MVLNTDNDENRRLLETCYRTRKTMLNPIIDWTEYEVWEFLRMQNCESNPLYKKGFDRIGCIMCPMGGPKTMKKEAALYPKYKECYIHAFDRLLERRKEKGIAKDWNNGEQVYRWWVGDDPNQINLEDLFEDFKSDYGFNNIPKGMV